MRLAKARLMRFFALLAGASVMATSDLNAVILPAAVTGEWGGPQVRLSLGDMSGQIEFSCASATIESPIRPDSTGKFSVAGHHTRFSGGPTPADTPGKAVVAMFTGHLDGDTLHLVVKYAGTEAESYTLERNRRVKLIRCQ